MTTRWFYAKNGQKVGPVLFDELRRLVQSGELGRTDMLLPEGSGRWIPVQAVLDQIQALMVQPTKLVQETQPQQGHRTAWRGTSVDLEITLPANDDLIPKPSQTELVAPKAAPKQGLPAAEEGLGDGRKQWATRRRLWLCLAGVGVAAALAVVIFSGLRRGNRQEEEPPGAVLRPGNRAAGSTITNSIGMKLALIPACTFLMGSTASEEPRTATTAEDQHRIEISRAFHMGVYEVTQAQYQKVMGHNPSWFSPAGGGKDKLVNMDTGQFPVDAVSWEDAAEFCKRLSALPEEKRVGRSYRLPTEAEWEYACRAGAATPYAFGSTLSSDQANIDNKLLRTTAVGSYRPNAFGLYDMHGNLWEWCADWLESDYYGQSPRTDPPGPPSGTLRVARGGCWNGDALSSRAAVRSGFDPKHRLNYVGFRVVAPPAAGTPAAGDPWGHMDPGDAAAFVDGTLRIKPQSGVRTRATYSGGIEIRAVARTEQENLRLYASKGASVIFNWDVNPGELRVNRPDGSMEIGSGTLTTAQVRPLEPNTWYTLVWRITEHGMSVSVDGRVVFREARRYDLSAKAPVGLRASRSVVEVRSFHVRPIRELQPAPGPTPSSPLPLTMNEKLTSTDVRDRVRQIAYCKVYPIQFEAGKTYQIDMVSGVIDSYLRLEDANKQQLAWDDDGGGFPNARIVFNCQTTATYRIICTTFNANATGPFTLTVRQK